VSGPDHGPTLEKYRVRAPTYDRIAPLTRGMRRRAVDTLQLRRGQVVLDVGCGTGLTFGAIQEKIGPEGQLVGIELSPEMLTVARRRVADHDWRNVTLLEAPAEEAQPPPDADAAVFVLVHDITQSPAAIANVVSHLRPGARLAVTGAKRAPAWAVPINIYLRYAVGRYITSREGFDEPWRALGQEMPDLRIRALWFGGGYLAWGTKPGKAAPRI
jgi:ubiquinone/menaquinone biosynthesis C-methylase UbiE